MLENETLIEKDSTINNESVIVNTIPENNKNANNEKKKYIKKNNSNNRFKKQQKDKIFEEKVVTVNRVTKVTKGGRQFRFAAIVVIGDKKGKVGLGTGKANEVPDAIKKAIKSAMKSLVKIPIVKSTIPHEIIGKYGGGKILLKPAKPGKGIIAGGPVRLLIELSGIKNIYSKSLGSNTSINMIRATLEGFKGLKTAEQFLFLKSKTTNKVEEDNKEKK